MLLLLMLLLLLLLLLAKLFLLAQGTALALAVSARSVTVVGVLFGVVFLLLLGQVQPVFSFLRRKRSPAAAQLSGNLWIRLGLGGLVEHQLVILLAKQNEGISRPGDSVRVQLARALFLGHNHRRLLELLLLIRQRTRPRSWSRPD